MYFLERILKFGVGASTFTSCSWETIAETLLVSPASLVNDFRLFFIFLHFDKAEDDAISSNTIRPVVNFIL